MNASRFLLPSSTLTGAIVAVVLALEVVKVVFGRCDAKFGCIGGVQFALLLALIAGLVSGVAWGVVLAVMYRLRFGVGSHPTLVACITGIVLALALPLYNSSAPFDSTAGWALGWATLSAFVASAVMVWSKMLPNKSLEAQP